MADVSLSTLPTMTVPPLATTATVDGTTDGANPFAGLLTALADPAMPVGIPPTLIAPPAGIVTTLPMPATATVPTLAPADADAEAATADADPDADDPADPDPVMAMLPPELSALLALMAPPAAIVATPVRTTTLATTPASIVSTTLPTAPQTSAIAYSVRQGPSPATSVQAELPGNDAAPPGPASPALSVQTEAPATIAPERVAQAFAAIQALATTAPARADTAPIPTTTAAGTTAAPAAPASTAAASGPVTTAPAPTSITPASPPIVGAAPQPAEPLPLAAATAVVDAEPAVAPRVAEAAGMTPSLSRADRADTAPTPTVNTAAPPEAPRVAPARTRKVQDTLRIGEARADAAPARIHVAPIGQAMPAPIADDPVARQLSIAQDGQWLDSLAKDIAGAGNANGRLHFRLDPDVLGSLTVQIAQGADGASIRLTASSEAARTILADAQPRLVAEARAQGLNLRDATIETRPATQAPTPSTGASFAGNTGGGRSEQGGPAAQLQQQSQQQQQGNRQQRAPDQPARANPIPRTPTSTRSGADLYA